MIAGLWLGNTVAYTFVEGSTIIWRTVHTVLVPPVKIQASVLLAARARPRLNLFSSSGGHWKSCAPPVTGRGEAGYQWVSGYQQQIYAD